MNEIRIPCKWFEDNFTRLKYDNQCNAEISRDYEYYPIARGRIYLFQSGGCITFAMLPMAGVTGILPRRTNPEGAPLEEERYGPLNWYTLFSLPAPGGMKDQPFSFCSSLVGWERLLHYIKAACPQYQRRKTGSLRFKCTSPLYLPWVTVTFESADGKQEERMPEDVRNCFIHTGEKMPQIPVFPEPVNLSGTETSWILTKTLQRKFAKACQVLRKTTSPERRRGKRGLYVFSQINSRFVEMAKGKSVTVGFDIKQETGIGIPADCSPLKQIPVKELSVLPHGGTITAVDGGILYTAEGCEFFKETGHTYKACPSAFNHTRPRVCEIQIQERAELPQLMRRKNCNRLMLTLKANPESGCVQCTYTFFLGNEYVLWKGVFTRNADVPHDLKTLPNKIEVPGALYTAATLGFLDWSVFWVPAEETKAREFFLFESENADGIRIVLQGSRWA